MLTIRHVEKDGRERVFTAVAIARSDEGFTFGTDEIIATGKIYVMNDGGKTVGVYDFDKKQNGAEHV